MKSQEYTREEYQVMPFYNAVWLFMHSLTRKLFDLALNATLKETKDQCSLMHFQLNRIKICNKVIID